MPKNNLSLTSIRGFAALWVVGAHWLTRPAFTPAFRLSYTAVDIFFVLSGLILGTVYQDIRLGSLHHFFLKRVFRIYPVHIVTLLALLLLITYPDWTLEKLRSIDWLRLLTSFLLINPFIKVQTLGNPPSWSLGAELVCYVVFPFALAAMRLNRFRVVSAVVVLGFFIVEYKVSRHFLGATSGVGAASRGLAGFGLGMAMSRVVTGLKCGPAMATAGEVCGICRDRSCDRDE